MTRKLRLLEMTVISALYCILCGNLAVCADVYAPQVLFSIPYGAGVDQIAIQPGEWDEAGSVSALTVPTQNSIVIADSLQCRVIRFDSSGRLEVVVGSVDRRGTSEAPMETTSPFRFIRDIAATPQGRLLLSVGNGTEMIRVWDSTGSIYAEGWDLLKTQIAQNVVTESQSPDMYFMDSDQAGYVYVHVSPSHGEYNVALAKFDPDLRFIGVMPGHIVGWNGYTYGFVPNRYPESNDRIRVFDTSGRLVGQVTLRPPAEISEGDYDQKTGRWRGLEVLVDGTGNLYLVLLSRRQESQWIEVLPDFRIIDAIVIYKFDPAGIFVTKLVLDGLPFSMDPPVAVDPSGNIYHLAYHPDRVDVVRYSPVASELSSNPSSEMLALRSTLMPKGWTVTWRSKDKISSAYKGHTRLDVGLGKGYASINGLRVPLSSPASLSSGRLYVPELLLKYVLCREQDPSVWAKQYGYHTRQ